MVGRIPGKRGKQQLFHCIGTVLLKFVLKANLQLYGARELTLSGPILYCLRTAQSSYGFKPHGLSFLVDLVLKEIITIVQQIENSAYYL